MLNPPLNCIVQTQAKEALEYVRLSEISKPFRVKPDFPVILQIILASVNPKQKLACISSC